MARGGLATVMGLLGGLILVLGGILDFVGDIIFSIVGAGWGAFFHGVTNLLLGIVFGVLIVILTGYARVRDETHGIVGGLVLIILAAIVFYTMGGDILILIAVVLTLLGGVIFLLEGAMSPPRTVPNSSH